MGCGTGRSQGKVLAGPLSKLWRFRVGGCRVICDIQDGAYVCSGGVRESVQSTDKVYRMKISSGTWAQLLAASG